MKPLPDYKDALSAALSIVNPLGQSEQIPLAESYGRVLAESVIADRDIPPFNRSQMDGYAVRAAEVGGVEQWPVAGTVAAGQSASGVRVPSGQCVKIATGAPLPAEVDAVVPHEQSDRADPVHFTISTLKPGSAVHHRGSDAREGDPLILPGVELGAHHLGVAAVVGMASLTVRRRPRVAILSSGDELVLPGEPVKEYQIRNSNGPQTDALLRRFGADPLGNVIVPDDPADTRQALEEALKQSDLVITIGGVSAGERDFFPAALDHHRVEPVLIGAAIQPGKPIRIGRAPNGCGVVCLPGNPVSCLVCATLFVWPMVRVMLGLDPALPWRELEMGSPVQPNPKRRAFRPAHLDESGKVVIPPWSGSGDLVHTVITNGIVELPVQNEPLEAGRKLRFLPWP